jgi:integrase
MEAQPGTNPKVISLKDFRPKKSKGKNPDKVIKYLSLEEVKRLIKVGKESYMAGKEKGLIAPVRDWMVIDLILNSGLRAAEVANLRISDICIRYGQSHIHVRNGKCGKRADVYISDKLKRHLKEFLRWKAEREEPLGVEDYLFLGQRGSIGRQGIQRIAKKYLKKARLSDGYSAHSLRHTYGTLYYKTTKDLRATQKQLRHTSIQNTQIYADVTKEELKNQADELSNLYR